MNNPKRYPPETAKEKAGLGTRIASRLSLVGLCYKKDARFQREHKTIIKKKTPNAICVSRLSTAKGRVNGAETR